MGSTRERMVTNYRFLRALGKDGRAAFITGEHFHTRRSAVRGLLFMEFLRFLPIRAQCAIVNWRSRRAWERGQNRARG